MDKSIESYTSHYLGDYGFEAEMVRYRRAQVIERLRHYRPRTVVEVGCGNDLQARHYQNLGESWDRWTIVEPSETFAAHAREQELPSMTVIEAFFEEAAGQIDYVPDLLLCSGLLHEVPDAAKLLESLARSMGPNTVLHLNVPNATSFHRQLAQAMGLIADVREISERNASLQQPRVYDRETLIAEIEAAGLKVQETGGYLVKPFTHKQMEPLVQSLGRDVLDGLHKLGQSNPDWASEIYIEARLS